MGTCDSICGESTMRRRALVGLLATVFFWSSIVDSAVPAVLATASPEPKAVRLDIKPGDELTTVTPGRGGVLPVVLYSSATFDAANIDAESIRFGPTGTETQPMRTSMEDERPGLVPHNDSIPVHGSTLPKSTFENTILFIVK